MAAHGHTAGGGGEGAAQSPDLTQFTNVTLVPKTTLPGSLQDEVLMGCQPPAPTPRECLPPARHGGVLD